MRVLATGLSAGRWADRKEGPPMPITSGETWKPYERGYHAVYHDGEVNHCPGCGRTHWLIGRLSAECAFCSTALPLREAYNQAPAAAPVFWTSRPDYAELNAA